MSRRQLAVRRWVVAPALMSLVGSVVMGAALMAPASADQPGSVSEPICHATGSSTNPYVSQAKSFTGEPGNGYDLTDGVFPTDPWGDIIPPYEVGTTSFAGSNWTDAGQLIFDDGCNIKPILTVTPDDQSMTVGGTQPTYTFSYSGFLNGDDASDIGTAPRCSAGSVSGVGTYPITCSGGIDETYDFTYGKATLTATDRPVLTVTPDDQTMTVGGTQPTYTFSYSGFLNGDEAADVDTPPTCAVSGTITGPGSYPITCSGGADDVYNFTYGTATLTVTTKKILTVTPDDKSMTYGDSTPTFTFTYSGWVGTDNAGLLDTQPTCSAGTVSGAGSYPITCSGGADNKYDFTYGTGSLTVHKAVLTVTPDNQTMTLGGAEPTYTFGYSGFVGGDDSTVIDEPPTCAADATSPAGTYPITCSNGSDDSYTFDYRTAILTVNDAVQSSSNPSTPSGPVAPNLTLTATANPPSGSTVSVGDSIDVTLTYGNTGGPASSAVLTETLPGGLALTGNPDGATLSADAGPAIALAHAIGAAHPAAAGPGTVLTWQLGTLGHDQSGTVHFSVVVGSSAAGTLAGLARLTAGNASAVTAGTTFRVAAGRISIANAVDKLSAHANEVLTYVLTVTAPAGGAAGVTVTDAVPAGATYLSGTCAPACSVSNGVLTWGLGDMAGGLSRRLTFQVTVDVVPTNAAGVQPATTITNLAIGHTGGTDVVSNPARTSVTAVEAVKIVQPPATTPKNNTPPVRPQSEAARLPFTGADTGAGLELSLALLLLGAALMVAGRRRNA